MDLKNILAKVETFDKWLTTWMARYGVTLLRVAVGLVYVWFGALKLIPGASPAEQLIRETITFLPANYFIPFLAVWEIIIGLGFFTGRFMRATILLMMLQIGGAVSPLVLNPGAVFVTFPFVLTLEGQYIIKNVVLIAAAIVVGATVRGGGLSNEQP